MNYYGNTTVVLPPKRKEENRKEKEVKRKEEKGFIPPLLDDVKKYVSEKNLKVNAKDFYNYFTEGNWIDSKGNQVKNWKQKILTWNGYSSTEKTVKKSTPNQREYDNLDFLYANKGE